MVKMVKIGHFENDNFDIILTSKLLKMGYFGG